MTDLHTAGLIVIKNKKLLLAYSKNKNAWYLPGGKLEKDESSKEALIREIREELNLELNLLRLEFFVHISAPAYGEDEKIQMQQDCFIYDLKEEISPGHEIDAIKYFDTFSYAHEAQVPGVVFLMDSLLKIGFIA